MLASATFTAFELQAFEIATGHYGLATTRKSIGWLRSGENFRIEALG
jgi:hypothetical protein